MSSSARIAMFVFLLLVSHSAASAGVVQLGQGVLIDDEYGAVIAGGPGEAVSAIRMADGERLWRSRVDAVPVMVHGDYIVAVESAAKAGVLKLVTLDRRNGKRVARATAELPVGVLASMAPDVSSRFELQPHPQFAASRLVWSFTPSSRGDEKLRALPQSGVLRVDPATARAGALDMSAPQIDQRAARLSVSFAGSSDPAFFSADRTHVIVSRRREDAPGFEWALYDRDSRLLGRVHARTAYAPFAVRGDVLLVLRASARGWRTKSSPSTQIKALDWRDAQLRWERSLSPNRAR